MEDRSTYVGNSDPTAVLTARIDLLEAAVALAAHGGLPVQDLRQVIDDLTGDPTGPPVAYSEDVVSLQEGVVGLFQSGDRIAMVIRFTGATEVRARRFQRAWLWPSGRIEFVESFDFQASS